MRILQFHHDLDPESGGVVRAVLDLCGALAREGHDVTLGSPHPVGVPASWRSGSGTGTPTVVDTGPTRAGHLRLGRRGAVALGPALATARVVCLHEAWTPVNLRIARRARRAGAAVVVSPHGMLDDWSMSVRTWKKRLWLALAGRRYFHRADVVLCTAEAEAEQARRWIPRARLAVAPLVVLPAEEEDTPRKVRLPRGPNGPAGTRPARLLFLSRLHPKKGLDDLLEAAAMLASRGRNVELWIAGSGDAAIERRLPARIDELGLADRTRILGFVDGPAKTELTRRADLLVLPTRQENYGLVLFEALRAGTPVLTTRGVDTWRELEASGAATILSDARPRPLADALEEVLDAGDLAARGAKGRAWFRRHCSPGAVVARTVEVYELASSVAAQRRSGGSVE